jgi:hypothetical protein
MQGFFFFERQNAGPKPLLIITLNISTPQYSGIFGEGKGGRGGLSYYVQCPEDPNLKKVLRRPRT